MQTHLSFEYSHRDEFPGEGEDLRTPHVLVEHFLEEYTEPGDRVLDIFAGFGTTLLVAEDIGRVPYGIEYEPERADWTREQISHSEHVHNGDILDLESVLTMVDGEIVYASEEFDEYDKEPPDVKPNWSPVNGVNVS